jgi:hypothetical protein
VKNLLVANFRPNGRVKKEELTGLIEAQIENSLAVGWKPKDIVVVTNLEIEVQATLIRAPLNEVCLTGSKMFALEYLFSLGLIRGNEVWWAHDLDAWQNVWFDEPELADIGLTEYSTPNFNGGSVFLRAAARDLVSAITEYICRGRIPREEPAIDFILRLPANTSRVTVLNSTYNVGCSAFAVRYQRSLQPVRVSHFHPSGISWRTHVWGCNKIEKPSVSPRLVDLLVRRFHSGVAPVPSAEDFRRSSSPRHYRLRESFHLGDSWSRLNYALRLLEQGEEFSIYLPNRMTRDILDSLDLGTLRPRLLANRRKPDTNSKELFRRIDQGSAAYACNYFPTKVRHRPDGKVVGYSLDAHWNSLNKVPNGIGRLIGALQSTMPSYTFQPIGQPHQNSIPEVIAALAQLTLLVSVDNGIAHVARSVGVPLYLIEHLHPLERGFPSGQCSYVKVSVDDALEKIVDHLALG